MKKDEAIGLLKENEIVYAINDYGNYRIAKNYEALLNIILASTSRVIFEYIFGSKPFCVFFDIDCKVEFTIEVAISKYPFLASIISYYSDIITGVDLLERHITHLLRNEYKDKSVYCIHLTSNSASKLSSHLIYRIYGTDNEEYFVGSQSLMKNLYNKLQLKQFSFFDKPIIDPMVYRENGGLFRSIYCTKKGENRPLILYKSDIQTDFELLSFVQYIPNTSSVMLLNVRKSEIDEGQRKKDLETIAHRKHRTDLARTFIDNECRVKVSQKRRKQIESDDKSHLHEAIEATNASSVESHILYHCLKETYPYTILKFFAVRKKEPNTFFFDFKSICIFRNRVHSNNNLFVITKQTGMAIGCFNVLCRKHETIKINIDMLPNIFHSLYGDAQSILNNFHTNLIEYLIRNIDSGVVGIVFDHTDTSLQFRTHITPKYKISYLNTMQGSHILDSTGIRTEIADFSVKLNIMANIPDNIICFLRGKKLSMEQNNVMPNQLNNKTKQQKLLAEDILFEDNDLNIAWHKVFEINTDESYANVILQYKPNIVYSNNRYFIFKTGLWIKDSSMALSTAHIRSILMKDLILLKSKYIENPIVSDIITTKITFIGSKRGILDILFLYTSNCVNEDFENDLNSNSHLFPFTNGTYDLSTDCFRELVPQDMISKTTGYEYKENPCTKQLYQFLNSILPEESERNYLLFLCSKILDGRKQNDLLLFILGIGSNGKSVFLKLLSKTFGSLSSCVSSSLFSRQFNNSGDATSDIMALKNKRLAYSTELDNGKINTDFIKRLTGGDEIYGREIYSKASSFNGKCKFVVCCNELPEFTSIDNAVWRRIVILEFKQIFVDNPTKDWEKPMNRNITEDIDKDVLWRQGFFCILLSFRSKIISIPGSCKEIIDNYREQADTFSCYLNDSLFEGEDIVLKPSDIWKNFEKSAFFIETNYNLKSNYKRLFEVFIIKKYGHSKLKYGNFRIRSDDNPNTRMRGYKGFFLV